MALSRRQELRYVSNVTVYRKTEGFGNENYHKVAEHVRCGIGATSNYDEPKPLTGLVKEDSVQTSDVIHFEASQDVKAEDVIFVELDSKQRAGEWYMTTGGPEVHEFRGNFRKLFINNTAPLKDAQIVT